MGISRRVLINSYPYQIFTKFTTQKGISRRISFLRNLAKKMIEDSIASPLTLQ